MICEFNNFNCYSVQKILRIPATLPIPPNALCATYSSWCIPH